MASELSSKGITWKHFDQPSTDELAEFVREVDLDPVDAEFLVQDHHRPEITVREQYILILLHVPVFDKKIRVTSGAPLYLLVTDTTLYTLQYEMIASLQKLFQEFSENPEKQEEYFEEDATSLALYVINQLHVSAFRKISRLAKHIEIAEDAVFHGNERKMVEEIAILSRDVLDFMKIIQPQTSLFSEMPDKPLTASNRSQWRRASGQIHQLSEMLSSLHESTKELRETNDSLLQHKENELLRMLSFYSIVTIPLWIFVSPFDPRAANATSADQLIFWTVLILLFIVLLSIFIRAKRRGVL